MASPDVALNAEDVFSQVKGLPFHCQEASQITVVILGSEAYNAVTLRRSEIDELVICSEFINSLDLSEARIGNIVFKRECKIAVINKSWAQIGSINGPQPRIGSDITFNRC